MLELNSNHAHSINYKNRLNNVNNALDWLAEEAGAGGGVFIISTGPCKISVTIEWGVVCIKFYCPENWLYVVNEFIRIECRMTNRCRSRTSYPQSSLSPESPDSKEFVYSSPERVRCGCVFPYFIKVYIELLRI